METNHSAGTRAIDGSFPIDVGTLRVVPDEPAVAAPVAPYRKTLKTEMVFSHAPEPEGSCWRNLCTLENELATMLIARPGAVVAVDRDVWLLRESGDNLLLCHATLGPGGALMDVSSRFDFDLDWVDVEADQLRDYNALLSCAIEEFDHHVRPEASLTNAHNPQQPVSGGLFSGAIVSVADGVVTQRINRAGETVNHNASKLSEIPAPGTVVDIHYRDGRGQVSGKGINRDVGR